jgi:hypothetical protein
MPSVSGSITIDAPADATWALIREFNDLPSWLPFVVASEIEGGGPANVVGAVRRLTGDDGGVLRESLLEHSDQGHYYRYAILESPLPVRSYVGEARVAADGPERSTLTWTSTWENDPEVEQEMTELLGSELLPAGLAAAKAALERPGRG